MKITFYVTLLVIVIASCNNPEKAGIQLSQSYCQCLDSIPSNLSDVEKQQSKMTCAESFLSKMENMELEYQGNPDKFSSGLGQGLQQCSQNIPDMIDLQKTLDTLKAVAYFNSEYEKFMSKTTSSEQSASIKTDPDQIDQSVVEALVGKYTGSFGNKDIVVSVDEVRPDGYVKGTNVYKNKTTEMIGSVKGEGLDTEIPVYTITLNEPSGNGNGVFTIYITSKDIHGNWKSYNGKLSREFELKEMY
jgi:hypothetical protein